MLIWFCKNCRAQEPVESTGDPDEEYVEGDTEKCIDCGSFCKVYNEKDLPEIIAELKAEEEEEDE